MKKSVVIALIVLIVLAVFIFYPDETLDSKYNKVKVGDTYEQAVKLLDKPDESLPEFGGRHFHIWSSKKNTYTWEYPFVKKTITDERSIQLVIKNNIVIDKYLVEHSKNEEKP